jgi:hypothetical protein
MSSKLITKEELKKIRVCDDNEVFKFFEQSDNDGVTLLFQSARRYTRGIPSKLVVLYKRHHQDFWVLTIRSYEYGYRDGKYRDFETDVKYFSELHRCLKVMNMKINNKK